MAVKTVFRSRLRSILDDFQSGDDGDGDGEFKDFNPLSYEASSRGSSLHYSSVTNRISLRKMRMKDLNEGLLGASGDDDRTRELLEEYRDFLLEPLEDPDAVLVRARSGTLLVVIQFNC